VFITIFCSLWVGHWLFCCGDYCAIIVGALVGD
jgi:hypothetical protein